MRARLGLFPVALWLAACASGTTSPPPAPASEQPPAAEQPAPPEQPAPEEPSTAADLPEAEPPEAAVAAAPDAWQLLDLEEDLVPGVSAARAYRELLDEREPQRTVVVAVIDGGVDTAHVDLRERLWRNADETPGNGVDDDGNGYVDDLYGWNFIGGADGQNVNHETLEVTRLHAGCLAGEPLPTERWTCAEIAQAYDERRTEVEQTLQQIDQIDAALQVMVPMLRQALGGEEPNAENVAALQPTAPNVQQAKSIFLQLDEAGITPDELAEAREAYEGLLNYGLDTEFETRHIVGDDFDDGTERVYGNADVMGPDAMHGTHVAGIIGAVRGNGIGIDGLAPVELMTLRAVPDGDERDKDVANAIRYAVDNGAHIINMSFGKAFSPRKSLVDEAVRYADERGVLMIHAAGNDGEDLESETNFPNRAYEGGGQASNWIEVGAANWSVQSLAAEFSNYGRTRVDVFAPGVDILSTVPGGEFEREDGTSMAAPVVTGVAAMLMAYFPNLTASQVRRILLESSVKHVDRTVPQPGSGEPVPFGTLSVTGGVVNAYEAVRMALEIM